MKLQTELRNWFTIERLNQLDLQKIEDLAGVERQSINYICGAFGLSKNHIEDIESIFIVLKMIENGFTDCNKD